MKRILWAVLAATTVLASCDRIEPEDVIIPNDNGWRADIYGDASENYAFEQNTDNNTYVLFEEFTGHLCSNCPGAALIAADLADHPRVILTGVHAGGLAATDAAHPADYTTDAGDEWWLQMTGAFLPCARFSRTDFEGDWFGTGDWETELEAVLQSTAGMTPARLQIQHEWQMENGHLNVHVESEFVSELEGAYRMELSIIENGLVSYQSNNAVNGNPAYPSPSTDEYDHEHVFRGNMNGTNGQEVAVDPVAGEKSVKSFTINWPAEWNPANCYLIAVITDGATGRVINAVNVHL